MPPYVPTAEAYTYQWLDQYVQYYHVPRVHALLAAYLKVTIFADTNV